MSTPLSQEERYLARVMFTNRLLKANGQAFQQLFWSVMRAKHRQAFIEIRPQGVKGDGGNDGFLPADGHYFQVYGPINPQEKVLSAAKKLASDFENLKKSWNRTVPILAYSFVFNDKYEGVFHDIAKSLASLGAANPSVVCRPYTAAHLETEFMNLSAKGMHEVLEAIIPDPSRVINLDYGVLKEVIAFIMTSPASFSPTRFGDLPDLSEKIQLNHLCGAWADLIRKGARQAGHIDAYFAKNSTFMKQALRDHLVKVYSGVRDAFNKPLKMPASISIEDLVFDVFRTQLLPKHANRAIEDAVEIIIGYYFEACDIFDPNAEEGNPRASPR